MNTEELRRVAEAATPLDFDSAEMKRRVGEEIDCPHCQGDGVVTLEADYCNFDGTAIGVEFYGIGMAHGAAEAFVRAFNPKTAIELLDRLAALEAENAALKQIVSDSVAALGTSAGCSPDCSLEFMRGVPVEIGGTVAALKADAERYRFVMDAQDFALCKWSGGRSRWTPIRTTEFLDAARSKT